MVKHMNNTSNTTTSTMKMYSSRSTVADSASTLSKASLNTLSFHRITSRATPTQLPRLERSLILDSSCDHRRPDRRTKRSMLIDNAVRGGGFLPYDYRTANTLESIRQQRVYKKTSLVLAKPFARPNNFLSPRIDAFGNFIHPSNHLSEQRLILRENSLRKKHNSSPVDDSHMAFLPISAANFVGDIPNALELVIRDSKQKVPIEQNLLESMRRERIQQGRYRLLPITRGGQG